MEGRSWRQLKEEIVAALCGVLIYYTWQARNWKLFRHINVNSEFVVTQIQRELKERLTMVPNCRKVRRCQSLIHRLYS